MQAHRARPTLLLLGLLALIACGLALAAGAVPGTPWAGLSVSASEATGAQAGAPALAPSPALPLWPDPAIENTPGFTYSIVELTAPEGTTFSPTELNNAAQVVGQLSYSPEDWQPAVWDGGVVTGLGTLGGPAGTALGVNDAGQVAGWADYSPQHAHGFLWQGGLMYDLGTLGGVGSVATAINEAGQIVGWANDEDSHTCAVLWQGGGPYNLGGLGGGAAEANDISDNGKVVGCAQLPDSSVTLAVLWDGGLVPLGTLGGSYGSAESVNDAGQVVGWSYLPGDTQGRAFLWQNGSMMDLGTLHGGASGAWDINATGQVIGTSDGAAVLWQGGTLYDLNGLIPAGSGWVLESAAAINDAGQIVGAGTHDGTRQAFLLTPVPWTLLFYLDGDNSLWSTYAPIFNRLEAAAGNPAVRIVVLWDNIASGDSAYYQVQYDTDLDHFASYTEGENYWPMGELDMSRPSTLSGFLVWAMERYLSPHYALILDNHGSGLGGGLCEGNPGCARLMTLRQMQSALSEAAQETGRTVDVLYMAMCLMGMLEDGYQFRGLAGYYVASENIQWAYTDAYSGYVAGIGRDSTAGDVAETLAASYAASGGQGGEGYTISVASLAQVEPLAAATYQLASALDGHLDIISPTLTTVLAAAQRYDDEPPLGMINLDDTYVDLYDLAARLAERLPAFPDIVTACDEVMAAVVSYVATESHASGRAYDLAGSHGVSVFFPATASSFYSVENYDFADGAIWGGPGAGRVPSQDTTWGAFLVRYFQATQPGGPDDETPPEPLPKRLPGTHRNYLPLILGK